MYLQDNRKTLENVNKKWVRVLAVITYVIFISLVAIVLGAYYKLAWDPKYDTVDLKIVAKSELSATATQVEHNTLGDSQRSLAVQLGHLSLLPSSQSAQQQQQKEQKQHEQHSETSLQSRILDVVVESLKSHREFHFVPNNVDALKKQLQQQQQQQQKQHSNNDDQLQDTIIFSIKLSK